MRRPMERGERLPVTLPGTERLPTEDLAGGWGEERELIRGLILCKGVVELTSALLLEVLLGEREIEALESVALVTLGNAAE